MIADKELIRIENMCISYPDKNWTARDVLTIVKELQRLSIKLKGVNKCTNCSVARAQSEDPKEDVCQCGNWKYKEPTK